MTNMPSIVLEYLKLAIIPGKKIHMEAKKIKIKVHII